MKAVFFNKHGGPEVLEYGDVPDPDPPGPGRAVLEIKAAALNHLDMFVRRGMPGIDVAFPHVPGCDGAGVVAAVGEGVTHIAPGDRVLLDPSVSCGDCEYCTRGDSPLCLGYGVIGEHWPGTCREKAEFPARNLIPIDDDMSFEDAASIALVFQTAWRMLMTRGGLRAGEDVLILGAAAGMGIACIQIAKQAGARVFAAASTAEKLELCRDLGADVLINYREENFVRRVKAETGKKGADMCVDYVGKDTWEASVRALARGGRLVTCGATTGHDPTLDLRHVFYRQLHIIGSTMGTRAELLAPLSMIERKIIRTVVGSVFDLKDTAEAHRLMESRGALGKIVVRVSAE